MREIVEIEPLLEQVTSGYLTLFFRHQAVEDPSVPAQNVVDVAHDLVDIAVISVVESVPALI